MSVLVNLAGKFDSDNLKVLVSKDTDKDVNNESTLYRDQDIPLNNMEAMLLSDDGFIKGKYMDSMFNILSIRNICVRRIVPCRWHLRVEVLKKFCLGNQ